MIQQTKKIEREIKQNPDLLTELTEDQKKHRMAEEVEEQIAKRG